jgi:hypothetical protein
MEDAKPGDAPETGEGIQFVELGQRRDRLRIERHGFEPQRMVPNSGNRISGKIIRKANC